MAVTGEQEPVSDTFPTRNSSRHNIAVPPTIKCIRKVSGHEHGVRYHVNFRECHLHRTAVLGVSPGGDRRLNKPVAWRS